MKAFVLKAPGQAVICDMPEPELTNEYSAILTPLAVSPCTSDVNTVYGNGSRKPDNLILGHECIAKVIEVGSAVTDFQPGDRVVVPAITPDYRNYEFEDGNDRHAGRAFSGNALGRSIPGVFAEKFEIRDADLQLAGIPENVSDAAALMCADMMATGFTGAEAAEIRFGDKVVVFGTGAVGLMAVAASRLRGAGEIIAVGSRAQGMKLAREFGADKVVNYRTCNIAETERNADRVIICGGDDTVMNQAVTVAKYGTGVIVNLKLFTGDGDISFSKFESGRGMGGKTIRSELCRGGRRWMERMLALVENGRVQPEKLVTATLNGFEKLPQALEMMRNKAEDTVKIMVVPEWNENEKNNGSNSLL